MTVCVAAICEGGRIIGASDRMLTSADIEFEPSQSKVWYFTPAIFAIVAGDAAVQTEILQRVHNEVHKRVVDEPENWWNVRDVAELYSKHYREKRLHRSEQTTLAPLGLDMNSFLAKQRLMDADVVARITNDLRTYSLSPTQAIFIGSDHDGPVGETGAPIPVYPHIYVADGPDLSCQDSVGFAAIGIGQFHAESQLMFAGHTRRTPFPKALFSVYSAKKRAEVAPGVGKETDMVSIGPVLGQSFTFAEHVISELETSYERYRKDVDGALQRAEDRIAGYLEEITKKATKSPADVPKQSDSEAPQAAAASSQGALEQML